MYSRSYVITWHAHICLVVWFLFFDIRRWIYTYLSDNRFLGRPRLSKTKTHTHVYMYARFVPRARLALNIFLPRIKSADYDISSIQALNKHGRQSNDDINFSCFKYVGMRNFPKTFFFVLSVLSEFSLSDSIAPNQSSSAMSVLPPLRSSFTLANISNVTNINDNQSLFLDDFHSERSSAISRW